MKKLLLTTLVMGLLLISPLPIIAQHFVPVYPSIYQPMNIVVDAATIDGIDLVAGDEIGIFDTTSTGSEICVGSIILAGPILPGVPLPIVASNDDPLTTPQDGFIDGHDILYRFWDSSEGIELYCVSMAYDPGFDEEFVSLGTALGTLSGILSASADAGPDDEICEDTDYTLSGSATNQQSVLWETSGDGSFDNASILTATYTPGPTDIVNGSATLTLTAYAFSPCGEHGIDDMVLTIQASPTADAGLDDDVCEDATYTLSGIATGQTSVLWSTAGDGSFDDATLLASTYTPGTNDISNGSVILTLTAYANSPCTTDASDDMLLSIQMLPTANAGDDGEICENGSYTLSGSATDYASVLWTTSGDGTFDDATLLAATYTPGTNDISNGTASLTLTAAAETPCGTDAQDMMVLIIQPLPTANAGADALICENESITLSGSASNQSTVSWSSAGDGVFDDPTILNATYTPGSGDISNGSVVLSLLANAIAPCGTAILDEMLLSIDLLPETPTMPDGPTIVDIHITPTSQYETTTTVGAISYLWSLTPPEAGSINGNGLTAIVTWNTSYHGLAYVSVSAVNDCGNVQSASLEVDVFTTVGIGDVYSDNLNVQILPNPSNGYFRMQLKAFEEDLKLAIFSSTGNIIRTDNIKKNKALQMKFDLSNLPKGIYFLRLYNDKTNHLEKIVIR